ncbi:formyltransferase family protein [Streptomyces sp. NPDC047002]|uniref:methionyl-tRNA formyltransferase n=1 Tax=Streptomyces sp. NPDC047002 TaxID=3155475 RepID=UPI00345307F5
MSSAPARIVVLSAFPANYRLVADWAERHGHEILLAVAPPGGAGRYGGGDLADELGKGVSLLVTGRLRTVAAPLIASLAPDLVISAAFPRLIPKEILDVPLHGAVNLHPTVLPAGRGPNPARLVYDGAGTIGATLHRTAAEFDTGAVLSTRECPLPERLDGPTLLARWTDLFAEVIEEGAARALRGEPGEEQDPAGASYAAPFTADEFVMDFTDTAETVRRKAAAVNVLTTRATVRLPDAEGLVRAVELADHLEGTPGTVLATHEDGWTVRAADRAVRLYTEGAPVRP